MRVLGRSKSGLFSNGVNPKGIVGGLQGKPPTVQPTRSSRRPFSRVSKARGS